MHVALARSETPTEPRRVAPVDTAASAGDAEAVALPNGSAVIATRHVGASDTATVPVAAVGRKLKRLDRKPTNKPNDREMARVIVLAADNATTTGRPTFLDIAAAAVTGAGDRLRPKIRASAGATAADAA
jgi:hypothetical protein